MKVLALYSANVFWEMFKSFQTEKEFGYLEREINSFFNIRNSYQTEKELGTWREK